MIVVDRHIVLGKADKTFEVALTEIEDAIERTKIKINPTVKGNGVKPIKDGVISHLRTRGWSDEHPMDLQMMRSKPLDGFKRFGELKVGLEWETGNISSSFRALMKLIKGLHENQLDLGVHILPSRAFYRFLTDRVGNITELLPYLEIFGRIQIEQKKTLIILVIEHDSVDEKALLIPKGLDGMSLKRRNAKKG